MLFINTTWLLQNGIAPPAAIFSSRTKPRLHGWSRLIRRSIDALHPISVQRVNAFQRFTDARQCDFFIAWEFFPRSIAGFRCSVSGAVLSNIYQQAETITATRQHRVIAKTSQGHDTSDPRLKLPKSKRIWWIGGAAVLLLFALAYYFLMPVAEVAMVRRGTAISAVYGTVRIEPAFVVRVRAQNDGFIQLAEPFSAGRGAIGKNVEKNQLLGTIADEETARQLKQARADLKAAIDRAALPLPSAELLKASEDNLQRLEKVVGSGNVPAVEYQKAKSEANRLRGAVETERMERDRNLNSLEETTKKLEAQMKSAEVRSPIDGLLTNVQTIDGELVSDGNELFTVSSRKNYLRGEVNEEDVGEVKP